MMEWKGDELYNNAEQQKERIELKRDIKDDLDYLLKCENIGFMDINECKKQNKGKVDNAIRCNPINSTNIKEYEKYLGSDINSDTKSILGVQ